jgi:hypothetical protein
MAADHIAFHTSGMGIGDAVSAYFVACGLADVSSRQVVYHCRHDLRWFSGVSHPNLFLQFNNGAAGPDCNKDYHSGQLAASLHNTVESRNQWLANNLARELGIERFKPVRPKAVYRLAPVIHPGYIVFSPFSLTAQREWPANRWQELARHYVSPGRRVLALDQPGGESRLKAMFGGVAGVSWQWGQSPDWVVSCIANADLFVGNDSGMTHIAGLMGTPSRAVMTHLRPEFVFSESPSVVGVDSAGWGCQGCAWQYEGGYRSRCDSQCDALVSLGIDRVVNSADKPQCLGDVYCLVEDRLQHRSVTTVSLLREIEKRFDNPVVLETGCIRSRFDWSAGYMTWVMGSFLETLGRGSLLSVDNDQGNINIARGLTRHLSRVGFVLSDSVFFLLSRKDPIDVAYLDSLDTYMPNCAEHGLSEAQAVAPLMSDRGIIVFDDSPADPHGGWSGKGKLGIPWLVDQGWVVHPNSSYQVMLTRPDKEDKDV